MAAAFTSQNRFLLPHTYLPSSQAVRFHWLSTGTQPPEIASREGFAFAIAKSICPWVGFVGISTNST